MNSVRGRQAFIVAMAAAVALGLSACSSTTSADHATSPSPSSSSSSSAAGLLQQVRKSSAAAKSVRIKGTLANETNKAARVQIDIAGDRTGRNTRVSANDGTGSVEILTVGGKSFLKADAAYWTKNGSAAIAMIAAGKYVEVPPGSAAVMGGLTVGRLLDRVFAQDIPAVDKLDSSVTKTELNGAPAYLMTTRIQGTKIYVSADGQAHLLRVVTPKSQQTTLDFSDWNAVPPTSTPPADQMAKVPGL